MAADGQTARSLAASGAEQLMGSVTSTGDYAVEVDWLDAESDVIRTEDLSTDRTGGEWTDIEVNMRSPEAVIRVVNDSSDDETVNGVIHAGG